MSVNKRTFINDAREVEEEETAFIKNLTFRELLKSVFLQRT
jgi:hypothetical protein